MGLGLKEAGLSFEEGCFSDSGRTIQTMGLFFKELVLTGKIPYRYDKRIREWCFGSFDGAYDGELFMGVLPRVFKVDDFHRLSLMELAEGIVEVDTTGWAESGVPWWPDPRRFEAIAKEGRSSWRWQCYCGQPWYDHYDLGLSH